MSKSHHAPRIAGRLSSEADSNAAADDEDCLAQVDALELSATPQLLEAVHIVLTLMLTLTLTLTLPLLGGFASRCPSSCRIEWWTDAQVRWRPAKNYKG